MKVGRSSKFGLRTALVVGTALALLGACDKGSKSGGGGGGGKGMAGASAVAPNGGLARALSMMPATSEMVIAIDFKQIRSSGLWKKYEDKLMGQIGTELSQFKAMCGWDPIEKASGALAAGRGKQMEELTVFVRGFDKAAVTDCIKKAAAAPDASGRAANIDGDYVELTKPGKDPIRFMFADDQTIVIQRVPGSDEMADKAALQKVLAAKAGDGLMSSATFSSLIDATDTGAAAWFVLNGNASFLQGTGMPFKFIAIFGSVKTGDGVDGVFKMRMAEDKDATGLSAMAQMSMGQIEGTPYADYAKGVKVSAKGKDVNVTFKFTSAQLEAMVAQAGMLSGM
ncbi:MAG: hypothetical protein IPL61_40755 [Myxococcales bacterium]|nr:hypothetical protein [Myxococcales bacterium]